MTDAQTKVARSFGLAVEEATVKSAFKQGDGFHKAVRSDIDFADTLSLSAFKHWAATHPLYGKRSTPPLDPSDWWRGVILDTFRHAGVAEQRTSTFFPNCKRCPHRLTFDYLAGLAPVSDELSDSLVRRFWGSEGYELHAEVDSFLRRLHALPSPSTNDSETPSSTSQRFPPPVVVSNTDPAVLKILDALGVTESTFTPRAAGIRHDHIFTTWLLEEDKKDVRFWEEVLRRLRSETGEEGLDPGEVLVVGDELIS